ncbi:MAG: YkgJ family cysteine cluster protein [Desulfobacteraceae bacterium]|jgi:Fe-S-cluster containining protein
MKAFECKKCGTCCYGEGGTTVQIEEIDRIAGFLEILRQAFISQFCHEENNKISIKTGPDGYCILYDQERLCLIHPVKPRLCALWPFYPALLKDKETWEMAKEACPGINPDCSFEEFVRQGRRLE